MSEHLLLTVDDVCDATQLGRTTVYTLLRSGVIPAVRIGRTLRVRRSTLERWLADHEEPCADDGLVVYPQD